MESITAGFDAPGQIAFRRRLYAAYAAHAEQEPSVNLDPSSPIGLLAAGAFVEFLRGDTLPPAPEAWAQSALDESRRLDDDSARFERVASFWQRSRTPFVSSVLVDRCRFGMEHYKGDRPAESAANAHALVAFADHFGPMLTDAVSDALGRPVERSKLEPLWDTKRDVPRADLWLDWSIDGKRRPRIRVWIDERGMSIGCILPRQTDVWNVDGAAMAGQRRIDGFSLSKARRGKKDSGDGYFGGVPGDHVYARWFAPDEVDRIDLGAEVVDATVALRPLLEEMFTLAGERPSEGRRPRPTKSTQSRARTAVDAPPTPQPVPEVEPPASSPRVEVERAPWIDALFASEAYRAQAASVPQARLDEDRVASALSLLHARGGTAGFDAIASVTGQAPSRVSGFLAGLARLLNADGERVLRVDIANRQVRLEQWQLHERFGTAPTS